MRQRRRTRSCPLFAVFLAGKTVDRKTRRTTVRPRMPKSFSDRLTRRATDHASRKRQASARYMRRPLCRLQTTSCPFVRLTYRAAGCVSRKGRASARYMRRQTPLPRTPSYPSVCPPYRAESHVFRRRTCASHSFRPTLCAGDPGRFRACFPGSHPSLQSRLFRFLVCMYQFAFAYGAPFYCPGNASRSAAVFIRNTCLRPRSRLYPRLYPQARLQPRLRRSLLLFPRPQKQQVSPGKAAFPLPRPLYPPRNSSREE